MKITNAEVGDSIFFACNKKDEIEKRDLTIIAINLKAFAYQGYDCQREADLALDVERAGSGR